MRRKELLINLLLLFSIVFFCLVIAEVGLRLINHNNHNSLFQYDSTLGWKFIPGANERVISYGEYDHYVKINANGLRDDNMISFKSNVFVLGDSFTSNVGVKNNEEVFTEVLERLTGNNVLNLGVNGYSTTQEYLWLKENMDKYKPSDVLLMFFLNNDLYDNIGSNQWIEGYGRPSFMLSGDKLSLTNVPVPRNAAWSFLKSNLRVVRLVDDRFRKMLLNLGFTHEDMSFASLPAEVTFANLSDERVVSGYALTCAILKDMEKYVESNDGRFYLVITPSLYLVRDDKFDTLVSKYGFNTYDRFAVNAQLKLCGVKNIIDLTPDIVAFENMHSSPYYYYPNEAHWTKEGNALVGQLLYNKIYS